MKNIDSAMKDIGSEFSFKHFFKLGGGEREGV
jgi:hypothetical protein